MPERMRTIPNREVARITLVVAATLFGLWLLTQISHVILLVSISIVLAVALEPAVSLLQRLLRSRAAAVAAMTILLVLFLAGFLVAIVPPIFDQANNLIESLPELRDDLTDRTTTLGRLEQRFGLIERLEKGLQSSLNLASNIPEVFGTVAGVVTDTLTVLILTLFFLLNAPRLKREGIALLPEGRRKRTAEITEQIFERVGGWMEGNLLISLVAGVVSFVALVLIGVPYPAALAMVVAITDLIPMVGALLGAAVCTLVALFAGLPTGLITLAFFLVYQQIENYLIAPRVMNRTVDVSAVTVIIAALVGGTLLGPVGVLLAVPAAASLKVVANEVWLIKRRTPA